MEAGEAMRREPAFAAMSWRRESVQDAKRDNKNGAPASAA
jgi:hypothetical protein